ncbi:SLATT domain-containing protein [Saccharicrinis fermentans]|uniref:SMODS and SLOG-associating 2TM effector domain-containing protein n=1 Tax=Saccharicrinis fermentans DSM 9555 = JCM 21142 TaxID=869213 RepID=W7YEU1_9BACT|nr:SLATT domain-containing protein [Saccharicrinis fermentans]GAF05988.1 hypothetical protein JCM21142_134754 [Saccharicrinis fermentans DSM 9555 = JCM 21142]
MKEKFIKVTYQQIWKTRGARFVAHANYLKQNKSSSFTIAILSAYVIVMSLFFISPSLNSKINNGDLSLITLAASLLTVIFSQIESSKDYKLKAEKLHQNAMELSDIYHESQALLFSDDDLNDRYKMAQDISKRYNSIIQKCDENHNDYDYKFFLASNWTDDDIKLTKRQAGWTKFCISIRIRYYYAIWILTPVILFAILTCL